MRHGDRVSPIRRKHTSPPPRICSECWWEAAYQELRALHKRIQSEFTRFVHAQKRKSSPKVGLDE